MSRQLEEGPSEDGGAGLVPGDEHGHEVVTELEGRGVLAAHVHEEPEAGREGGGRGGGV